MRPSQRLKFLKIVFFLTLLSALLFLDSAQAQIHIPPPSITTQPTNQTVDAGATVTFTAAASGIGTVTVQWQVSADGGATYQELKGAISSSYSFTATSAESGYLYQAVFTDGYGSTTTNAASLTCNQPTYTPYTFATIAGENGVFGSANFVGPSRLNNPSGTAVDGSGNVYIANAGANTILKMTPAGVVTTFAGQAGVAGSTDGMGSAALFNLPIGVAVDKNGNVFVADTGNDTIREITPAGVVTTLAGQPGTPGSTNNNNPSLATFTHPYGVAVDGNENVYVADTGNGLIRMITAAGVVTTLAGSGAFGFANGTGTAAVFYNPCGVAVNGNGIVYVADTYNNSIRQITPGGVVTTLADAFDSPYGVVEGSSNRSGPRPR